MFMDKFHRLLKVLYIIFSVILFWYILFNWGYENLSRYEWYSDSFTYKGMNWSWSLLAATLFTLLQILFSDFVYRIGSYINIGKMKWFLKYSVVPWYWYIVILWSLSLLWYILFSMWEDYADYCENLSWERDKWQCMCWENKCSESWRRIKKWRWL